MEYLLALIALLGLAYNIYLGKQEKPQLSNAGVVLDKEIRQSFISEYLQQGYEIDLIEVTYKNLQAFLGNHSFLFDKKDHLKTTYTLSKEEIKDLLIDICVDLQFDFPRNKDIVTFEKAHGEIKTFQKILMFIRFIKNQKRIAA